MSAEEYESFRDDLERRGILVPIEATAERVVLDGRARLRAATELEWERVPVRIVAPKDEIAYMVLAAIRRRQLTASQKAALVLEWSAYAELRAQGKERQRQNLRQNAEEATLPPRGKTRERVAENAGASERTAQDVISVYEEERSSSSKSRQGRLPLIRPRGGCDD